MAKSVSAEDLGRIKEQEYLLVSEAAILCRKSRKTVYDAIYSGELKSLSQGTRYLIRRCDLDALDRGVGLRAREKPTSRVGEPFYALKVAGLWMARTRGLGFSETRSIGKQKGAGG